MCRVLSVLLYGMVHEYYNRNTWLQLEFHDEAVDLLRYFLLFNEPSTPIPMHDKLHVDHENNQIFLSNSPATIFCPEP